VCLEEARDHIEHDLVKDPGGVSIEFAAALDLSQLFLSPVDEVHALDHLLPSDLVREFEERSWRARALPCDPSPFRDALEHRFDESLDLVLAGLGVLAYGVVAFEIHHCCSLW